VRNARLDEILSPEQIDEVLGILNSTEAASPQQVHKLKGYLRQHKDELLAKEILPDYLAYAIAANVLELVKRGQ
jgi:hypothetical protein